MDRLRPLLLPAIFTLLVGTLLVGLGIWQLHRLAWKQAIIARIETRAKAPPQPLPAAPDWSRLTPDDYEYRHVTADGTYDNGKETLVFRGSAEGPGYLVLTPFRLKGGDTVIVDRGFVPETKRDQSLRKDGLIEGETRLTGLMRSPEPRNMFTPADEPAKNLFFTRDPLLIAAHAGLVEAAPFTIDADRASTPGVLPHGGATELSIPNNHLSYALTWFGLALGLFGVFGHFAWRRLTRDTIELGASHPTARVSHG